jgi:glucose/arabinose dehydrogenase
LELRHQSEGRHVKERAQGSCREGDCARDYARSSHVAPLGLVFNTGSGLPASYQGGAFVGEHGSWDRPQFNDLMSPVA